MTREHIALRKAAEMALEAMDMDAEDADKISWERLAKIVVAGTALRDALAEQESADKAMAAAPVAARWPRSAEHTLRMFRRTQLELGVPTAKLMPEDLADAVAWLVLYADLGDGPCIHGIRAPHECKECAGESSHDL